MLAMANLSLDEFERCISLLAEGGTPERLRDRLARLNAFHSRRGLNSVRAIAERMYTLSAGLRRDVPPARAFHALWAEHVGTKLSRKTGAKLDELADKVNEHLESDGSVKEGERAALEAAVAAYEDLLARKVGGDTARLDTLQKAVPEVAALLRAKTPLEVALDPPEADDDDDHEHDHQGHAHAHHEENPAAKQGAVEED